MAYGQFLMINELLKRLLIELRSDSLNAHEVLSAAKDLLIELCKPENNTDENCKRIDHQVMMTILDSPSWDFCAGSLPHDLRLLVEDIGTLLHDAHSDPHIAEMFDSKPEQLLRRAQALEIDRSGGHAHP